MRSVWLWMGALVVACGCAKRVDAPRVAEAPPAVETVAPPETGKATRRRTEFLNGQTLMELVEQSPRLYLIEGAAHGATDPDKTLRQLYPLKVKPRHFPQVRQVGGRRVIGEWPTSKEADLLLTRAETFFEAKDYKEAGRLAEEATRKDPDNYWAWLYRGDCEHFADHPAAALELYRKSASLNPYDYRVHFFQASALVRLGRAAEARQSFARALALNPRGEGMVERIRKDGRLDFTVAPLLSPRFELNRKDENTVEVRTEPDAHHWLAFGLCKAVWIMEPAHRGTADHFFSSLEEQECLGLLAMTYATGRQRKAVSEDEGLEIVLRAWRNEQLPALVVYELASRFSPQIALTLSDDEIDGLTEFVDRYIFIEK